VRAAASSTAPGWIRSRRTAAGWIKIPPLGDPFSCGALDQDPAAGWITRKPPLKATVDVIVPAHAWVSRRCV